MQRRRLCFAMLVLCLTAFVVARSEATVDEIWLLEQRVRWTTNKGERGTETYVGQLRVTVALNQATDISSEGSTFLWSGAFTAPNQPWRDPAIRSNYLVFDAVTPAGDVLVGCLRPNKNWTRLTGKVVGSVPSGVDPSLSYYYEITVKATLP